MSLPSVTTIMSERNIITTEHLSDEEAEKILLEAMERDCPEAIAFLRDKAEGSQGSVDWLEDPNSKLGRQLIRIHAGDPLRLLAETHFCRGKKLTFFNCCGGSVGAEKPPLGDMVRRQLQQQNGEVAFADC